MRENVYPNDDPDTAAKKIAKDFHFTIPENGNGKDKNKKHSLYVQKYTEPGLIAEAVIIGGVPYFAVARSNSQEYHVRRINTDRRQNRIQTL